jgi:hypothetical protein
MLKFFEYLIIVILGARKEPVFEPLGLELKYNCLSKCGYLSIEWHGSCGWVKLTSMYIKNVSVGIYIISICYIYMLSIT